MCCGLKDLSNGNCYAGCPKNVAMPMETLQHLLWNPLLCSVLKKSQKTIKSPHFSCFLKFCFIYTPMQWMLGDSTLVCVTLVTWSATVTMSTCPLDQIWSDYQLWFQLDSSWLIDLRCDNLMNSLTVSASHQQSSVFNAQLIYISDQISVFYCLTILIDYFSTTILSKDTFYLFLPLLYSILLNLWVL